MDPALYKAATQGNVEMLRQLVDPEDPSILSSTTPQLNTVLHLAALHGHTKFAREVLDKNGELLVAQNDDGDTPLHLAAKASKLEVAKLLIGSALAWQQDENRPLIMTNKAGNNALHEAVQNRRSAVALALLDADPYRGHDLNRRMESPLHMAAPSRPTSIFGNKMESPLHMASREGLLQVVRRIVDTPSVELQPLPSVVSLSGTALHQAVLGTHLKIVEILLEKRPELTDLCDSEGNNALHYAAQKNHRRAVEMLLNKRTDLAYKRNLRSFSPLHVAAHYGSADAIKALLQHCPDVAEMVDRDGQNAFHACVASGKAIALTCLLRRIRPAELLNRADNNGDTPLLLAVKMGHVHTALELLGDRRVDPCVRDRDMKTARSIVEMKLNTGELDAYEMHLLKQLKQEEAKRCRKQQLPPFASDRRRPLNNKDFDSVVDSYFLAATLIATVTFAATFTMPGGYDQTRGIALHGRNAAFKTFVVSNTIAMCSSIVVIFLLIWARQEPIKLRLHNLMWSQTLTVIACFAMLISLMTAVYITVAPTASWPAYVVIAIGASSPVLFFFISWLGSRNLLGTMTTINYN
ncbi:unnamed protein product [Urochloa decumbens]|uniref:PGG domain-containing protein n=1 Tax=Urochloa decumbens TaxID=240449 RepID=A0ABC9B1D3_9POAL